MFEIYSFIFTSGLTSAQELSTYIGYGLTEAPYQQLSHAIGLIMAVLDSLDKNQVIIDIKNRLSALEDQKKENK